MLAFDGPRSFAHDAVLTVQVSDQETNGDAITRDVILQRGATPLPVDDFYTSAGRSTIQPVPVEQRTIGGVKALYR